MQIVKTLMRRRKYTLLAKVPFMGRYASMG